MSQRVAMQLFITLVTLLMHSGNASALEKHYIKAKPGTCVTTQTSCQINLLLSWQGEPTTTYCLQVEAGEPKLICDVPNRAQHYKLSLEAASDVMIYLVRKQDKQRVAQVMIDVQRHFLNQKRRKVAWSIF
ncbi:MULTISPECIES: DUF3019 domain-containing protein [unclassified Pseudoalteromonas]|uniref:DUF3019 domain-containing protein n=1 Tax=unclassified Pseudoalteromonas TaxID=194690 RepID=UPI000CF6CCC8|nr:MULTISPECIES: DUF3019 domain-containing protein [unclassified Pseudoalteromonas]